MATGFRLDQCAAIITGASSGLGSEFALQLAPHATRLLLTARTASKLEEVKARLLALNPRLTIHTCPADMTTDEGRARLVDAVSSLDFQPNLLINNAGMGDYGTFASASTDKIRAQLDLNITGVVMLTHALLPKLVATAERPAGILNVSSLAGNVPMPDLAVYGASKSFVTSFTEALHIELAPRHIHVTAVCPGPTPTNFGHNARREAGEDTNRDGQGFLRILPSQVVAAALAALQASRALVFPGLGVSIAGPLFRIMPRPLMRWILQRRHAAETATS